MAATTNEVKLEVKAQDDLVHICVRPPEGKVRSPLDVVAVIDVSGSMGEDAERKPAAGGASTDVEIQGFSVLDIVKHAVATIIHSLGPSDRLSLVSFTDDAKVCLPLTSMTPQGVAAADTALKAMQPDACTNLWAGLLKGMEVLNAASERQKRFSVLMLLTDGVPTSSMNPPQGIQKALKDYADKNGLPGALNTFGFGYKLDSELLRNIAVFGNGSYGFIPDSSLTGTIFVNALSNAMTTMARNVSVSIELEKEVVVDKVLGGYQSTNASWGTKVDLGALHYGQTTDLVLHMKSMPADPAQPFCSVTLGFDSLAAGSVKITADDVTQRDGGVEVSVQANRLKVVKLLRLIVGSGPWTAQMAEQVLTLAKELRASPSAADKRTKALIADLEGQVTEAVSRQDWYKKWGVHYLPSLMQAHLQQQCNNFKDPGVQVYGGALFNSVRDTCDDVFLKLPPPTPSKRSEYGARRAVALGGSAAPARAAPTSMRSFYNASSGCFAGSCQILMADGATHKQVCDVVAGDVVSCGDSSVASVVCVVKMNCEHGKILLTEFNSGLQITPWHPISLDGGHTWSFPAETAKTATSLQQCPAVYDLVLSSGHIVIINGVQCVTFGHHFSGDCRQHEYFGSDKVLADLAKLPGWSTGFVEFSVSDWHRDSLTGLITGLHVINQCSLGN